VTCEDEEESLEEESLRSCREIGLATVCARGAAGGRGGGFMMMKAGALIERMSVVLGY